MSDIRFYQTDDMEASLASMVERNHQVVALVDYRCGKRIRFRAKASVLANTPMRYVLGYKPEAQGQIERWQREGGGLLYRTRGGATIPTHPANDALLICEAPFQWKHFQAMVANTRQDVVIYRPPTWDLHNLEVEHRIPPRYVYETLEAVLKSLEGRELPPHLAAARDAVPWWNDVVVFDGDEIHGITGWDERYVRAVMRNRYKITVVMFDVISLRFPPEDKDMRWAYDIVRAQPEVRPRHHLMRRGQGLDGYRPGFKRMFTRLVRWSHVVRESGIFVVNAKRPELPIDEIEAIHNMRRGKWFKVKSFIDELPEYDYGQ